MQGKLTWEVYKAGGFRDNPVHPLKLHGMAQPKNKQELRLQELIQSAKRRNIQVRTEKLLREAGYRAKSGSCRVKGQDVILIDRDARIADQIEFLAGELAELPEEGGDPSSAGSEN
ncbi:MAG TPA: hypothetical protein VJQ55_02995 [Candidatus Binatia bacterium]|nr:hypothetical protein [Candidatus Binatia bacterium]